MSKMSTFLFLQSFLGCAKEQNDSRIVALLATIVLPFFEINQFKVTVNSTPWSTA